MRRRKLILIAASVVLGFALVVAGAAVLWVRSSAGLSFARGFAERQLESRIHGRVTLGALRGSLLGGQLSVDTIEIRDRQDSVVFASGLVSFEYSLVDVIDRLLALRNVRVQRPYLHLRQDSAGAWNHKSLARGSPAVRPPTAGRQFGDFITIDSLTITDGLFRVTSPWSPDVQYQGSVRDSVIAAKLANTAEGVVRVGRGFFKTWSWTDVQLVAPRARLRHRDSAGVAVRLARLDVRESDPPFDIRDLRGSVRVAKDTVHLDVEAFRLPGSTGSARGIVGLDQGTSIAIRVIADTVSLADVAWLMPTFPREGGGRVVLDIRKTSRGHVTQYALSRMDVQTAKSRLRGAMTFGVGDPVLALTNVDLDLQPVDFKLFEVFAGEPLSQPWAGQLTGRVRGPGGPLDHFIVDEASIAFTDANVPGVVNRFRGAGELDIVNPAFVAFHDFGLDIEHFDLRTVRAVNPKFPPLAGTLTGVARLDSLWTDIRFREADVRYLVASKPESRFTGMGRATLTETDLVYDLALDAAPISLDALAVSYPTLPVRGSFSGPFTVRGVLADLTVTGDMRGDAGRLRADLRMDLLEPSFAVNGSATLFGVDPSRLLVEGRQWPGSISAIVQVGLTGDSLSTLSGGARVSLSRSTFADVRVFNGTTSLRFGDGLLRLDTLAIESTAGALSASGAFGLRADRRDSIQLSGVIDSLGGLRPLFGSSTDSLPADSLAGSVTLLAKLTGNVDSADVTVRANGRDLAFGTTTMSRAQLTGDIADLFGRRAGTARINADTTHVGGIALASALATAQFDSANVATVVAHVQSTTGPVLDGIARIAWDSAAVRTRLDSLRLDVGDSRWRLALPTTIVAARTGVTIDSLELVGGDRGRILVVATLPDSAGMRGLARVEGLSLADLSKVLQMRIPLAGSATAVVTLGGTRISPTLDFEMLARDAQVGETRLEGMRLYGQYRDRALRPTLEYRRNDKPAMTAAAVLPMDLAFGSVGKRLLDGPLSGTLRADSADLAIIESFSSLFAQATGRLHANLDLGGTWERPRVAGRLTVENGSVLLPRLGAVRLTNLESRIQFSGDSITVETLAARSGGTARIAGEMQLDSLRNPRFDLRFYAAEFNGIAKSTVANLDVTGSARLAGRLHDLVLTGTDPFIINGNLYVPDALKKDVIALEEEEFFAMGDTAAFERRRLLGSTPTAILENLRVQTVTITAGPNLWLRSEEADIQLGGTLAMGVTRSQRGFDRGKPVLSLEGRLVAQPGGTYRLNIGGFIQKTFVVESGEIRFFGDEPDLNPTIDISAIHTVRQYDQRQAQQDVRIRAHLGGTLANMTAELSSPDSLRISNADLLSYLTIGAPSFEIGGRASDYTSTLARIGVTSFGSLIGSRLAGSWADVVDVRTSGQDAYGGDPRAVGGNILAGTRIAAGKQIGDRWFVRAEFGLCQVGQVATGTQSFDPVAFANSVGGKLDYRFSRDIGISGGVDPPTSAILCTTGAATRGFVPSPRQWGLDLFKLWRF
jgi:translocation and assembly module TamB